MFKRLMNIENLLFKHYHFCIFVLAENLFQDAYVSKLLKSDITQSIPFNLRHLMNQLEGEDRECFITDFCLMGFAID